MFNLNSLGKVINLYLINIKSLQKIYHMIQNIILIKLSKKTQSLLETKIMAVETHQKLKR